MSVAGVLVHGEGRSVLPPLPHSKLVPGRSQQRPKIIGRERPILETDPERPVHARFRTVPEEAITKKQMKPRQRLRGVHQQVNDQPEEEPWETHTKQEIERYFWPWSTLQKFLKLRERFLDDFRRHPKRIYKGRDLLDLELYEFTESMKCGPCKMPIQRTRKQKLDEENGVMELSWVYKPMPLAAGHFGVVIDHSEYTSQPSVLKLARYEHMQRPLDMYSFYLEILLNLVIQYRGFRCTPHILSVVRTREEGDIGYVMEKCESNLYDFFLEGLGSQNLEAGLRVLQDTAAQLFRLQDQFDFRHRDFRMKNIMVIGKQIAARCVRIIDLGKASLTFQGLSFSAYAGQMYEAVESDFDLGFFFGDMLIHFMKDPQYGKQLKLYEKILSHFLQGITIWDISQQHSHLQDLMERVQIRSPETRVYSTPRYVFKYLQSCLDKLSSDHKSLSESIAPHSQKHKKAIRPSLRIRNSILRKSPREEYEIPGPESILPPRFPPMPKLDSTSMASQSHARRVRFQT